MGRRTQKERSEKTKAHLVEAATKLFAERGFQGAGTEELVGRTGLTRGALYHHFEDKRDLFRAVVEHVEKELGARISSATLEPPEPLQKLRAGLVAFLDACREPEVRQIVLLDAPAVLGVERWRSVEADYGLDLLRQGLQAAMGIGAIQPQRVEPLARLLLGAFSEAGLYVAESDNPDEAKQELVACIDGLIQALMSR
jgi:AcrR family transcriptional regulator